MAVTALEAVKQVDEVENWRRMTTSSALPVLTQEWKRR